MSFGRVGRLSLRRMRQPIQDTLDEVEFQRLVEPYRRALEVHCYRMLGSLQDAEDMVQETLLRAWRSLERFESRSSIQTWLYRIATNACLDELRRRPRRPPTVGPYPDQLPEAAVLRMPPQPSVFGAVEIARFFSTVPAGGDMTAHLFTPTRANGRPAVVMHRRRDDGTLEPHGIQVVEVEGDRIVALHAFIDETLPAVFAAPGSPGA